MGIGCTHRYYLMTESQVELRHEALLDPELLEGDLATTLNLLFKLAYLFLFHLHGSLHTTMLKLNLRAHRPSLSKVITNHDYDMWEVKLAVPLGILVVGSMGIAVDIVAVEVVGIDSLAISSQAQSRQQGLRLCRLGRVTLGDMSRSH